MPQMQDQSQMQGEVAGLGRPSMIPHYMHYTDHSDFRVKADCPYDTILARARVGDL